MTPIKIIYVVGRSNVGKSQLLRALTGESVPVGKRPGVTTSPVEVISGPLRYVDMAGFGFMKGTPRRKRERIKADIVREIEEESENIDLALLVLDAKVFSDIFDRWESRGEIPIGVELHDFLLELDIPLIIVANKMDKVSDPDWKLDGICDRLGYLPPWRQWGDVIVPVSAKGGEGISCLKQLIAKKLGLS